MLDSPISQRDFADLVGVSEATASNLVKDGVIAAGDSGREWVRAYCGRLREQSAGWNSALSAERARLARAQAEKVEMANARMRHQLAPVTTLETTLATLSQQIAAILEALPGKLKRRSSHLTPAELEVITGELVAARNLCAAVTLDPDDDIDDDSRDPESDTQRAEAA